MIASGLLESRSTILISGPSGSGKSRRARLIHEKSLNSIHQFYQVNVTALSKGTFESELFGHLRGAFTGANCDKKGFVSSVGKGTLFLDEIGDLSLEMQAKLLMLLEEGIYYPVGSTLAHKSNARFILATSQDLDRLVKGGKFREDLFYRISTFEIAEKPLCQRADKQEVFEKEFVRFKQVYKKNSLILSDQVLNFFTTYNWPGNYREMKNALEHMVVWANDVVTLQHLPAYIKRKMSNMSDAFGKSNSDYWEAMEKFEKNFLFNALSARKFRINMTSREIGISKVTLLSKMKKYGIQKESISESEMKKAL